MINLKKIVVATDFSTESTWALKAGLLWSKQLKAQLQVLHVDNLSAKIESVFLPSNLSHPTGNEFGQRMDIYLQKQFHDQLKACGVESQSEEGSYISIKVLKGEVEEVLLPYVNDKANGVAMLVVGGKNQGLINRIFLGSSLEKLGSNTEVPMLVVKNDSPVMAATSRPPSEGEKALVFLNLTDFSEAAEKCLPWMVKYARVFSAEIEIVHIVSTDIFEFVGEGSLLSVNRELMEKILSENRDWARNKMRELEDKLKKDDIKAKCEVKLTGEKHLEASVVDYVDQSHAEIVFMGKSGKSSLEKFFLGSTARNLLRHSAQSLMIIP
jgi:nucleotide-binding universal stress UspA family protein